MIAKVFALFCFIGGVINAQSSTYFQVTKQSDTIIVKADFPQILQGALESRFDYLTDSSSFQDYNNALDEYLYHEIVFYNADGDSSYLEQISAFPSFGDENSTAYEIRFILEGEIVKLKNRFLLDYLENHQNLHQISFRDRELEIITNEENPSISLFRKYSSNKFTWGVMLIAFLSITSQWLWKKKPWLKKS